MWACGDYPLRTGSWIHEITLTSTLNPIQHKSQHRSNQAKVWARQLSWRFEGMSIGNINWTAKFWWSCSPLTMIKKKLRSNVRIRRISHAAPRTWVHPEPVWASRILHISFLYGIQLKLQTYDRWTGIHLKWPDPFDKSEAEKDKIIYPGQYHWRSRSVFRIRWYAHVADGRVLKAPYIRRSQPHIGIAVEISPHKRSLLRHKPTELYATPEIAQKRSTTMVKTIVRCDIAHLHAKWGALYMRGH